MADIAMLRLSVKATVTGLGNLQGNLDFGGGQFRKYNSADLLTSVNRSSLGGFVFNNGMPIPSLGCAITPFTSRGFFDDLNPGVDDDPISFQRLDAGASLNLAGPLGAKQFSKTGGLSYDAGGGDGLLGGGIPGVPGLLTIPGNPPVWTNQDALSNIPRSQDMTVTWSGGVAGTYIWILGSSADPATKAGAEFICTERAEAGTFTVPSWVLSAMPASGPDPGAGGTADGFLTLQSTLAQPVRFQATGIDVGFFNWSLWQGKNVKFQ